MAISSHGGPAAALIQILARLRDPVLTNVALYWRSKLRTDGRLPGRAHLDPVEIPSLLPNLFLIDVERNPLRFRYRLAGTRIVEWSGHDATGSYLDVMYGGERSMALSSEYRLAAENGLPRYQESQAHWPNREYRIYNRLLLPLAADGTNVDMLLGAINIPNAERGHT